jgi:hypothetical protein
LASSQDKFCRICFVTPDQGLQIVFPKFWLPSVRFMMSVDNLFFYSDLYSPAILSVDCIGRITGSCEQLVGKYVKWSHRDLMSGKFKANGVP